MQKVFLEKSISEASMQKYFFKKDSKNVFFKKDSKNTLKKKVYKLIYYIIINECEL